ncbi:hypothetical protein [Teredinibacter sp. KSP-S5-2]|uniref:hypothetical protein n=1 Tax=Teredinibacter sp. KSP-S5-2 TaxID=3034506 RepID=UPI002934F41C|nr:hypothetical protein [Teredinibacter sp. KSP-S5-2]WNO09773.1 hypothetical protein P5V12_01115 [Teredinibacter sp. KSP-S5-2]
MKLNLCCEVDRLITVREIYQSNSDDFVMKMCPSCSQHWLYRYLEEDWRSNIQLGENEYEAWYIGVLDEELQEAYNMAFDNLSTTSDFLYLSSKVFNEKISDWKKIAE